MKLCRHTVCCDDVFRLEDKLFLLPQLLLEILDLCQKIDDFLPDLPDHPGPRDVFVQEPLSFQSLDGDHFRLDEIIKLFTEECFQVLVDEKIPGVLGGEAGKLIK